MRSGVYNYEISSVCPTTQMLLKWISQLYLLCLTDVFSLFNLSLSPKGPLGEVIQKQMITEWYKYEKLKLISGDEIEPQMSNTFFLWEVILMLQRFIWALMSQITYFLLTLSLEWNLNICVVKWGFLWDRRTLNTFRHLTAYQDSLYEYCLWTYCESMLK